MPGMGAAIGIIVGAEDLRHLEGHRAVQSGGVISNDSRSNGLFGVAIIWVETWV